MKQPVHNPTRQAERRMNLALLSAGMVGFDWHVQTGRLQLFGAVAELLGLPAEATVHDYLRLIHPEDRRRVEEAMRSAPCAGHAGVEYRLIHPDGAIRWLLGSGAAERAADGRVVRITGLTHDITDRRRAEDELRDLSEDLERRLAQRTREVERGAAQLRRLAADVIQAEQRDRRRIAQAMHDSLQQLLVASRMRIGRLIRRSSDPQVAADARQVDQLLAEAIEDSRALTQELSPSILHEGGLVSALEWLARQMEQKHALRVELQARGTPEPHDPSLRVALFMAVREILHGVRKRGGTHARITLAPADGRIRIAVEHRGAGHGADAHAAAAIAGPIQLLGGTAGVHTGPGGGECVEILVPVAADAPDYAAADISPISEHDGNASANPAPAEAEEPGGTSLRVLLADDHATVREGLAGLLREQPGIEVVGEAENGLRAVELARALRPDVVVMDVTMPVLGGVEATRRITRAIPGVRVVGLSMHEREDMAAEMIDAGAATYLTKGIHFDTLIAAIRGEGASPWAPLR